MADLDPDETTRSYLTQLEQQTLHQLMTLPGAAVEAVSDEVHRLTATLAQRAERLKTILSRLPHNVAEGVLERLAEPTTLRPLTPGERSNAVRAFGRRALILVGKARISNGAGKNPIALLAFYNDHRRKHDLLQADLLENGFFCVARRPALVSP